YGALAAAGAVAVCDDGASIASAGVMRHALAYATQAGLRLIQHAEDTALARNATMRDGDAAVLLGLAGWPASAESTVVARDLELARETGAQLHVTHLSTREALEHVRRARRDGVPVTCDVTPHHLAMTDRWVAGERRFAWEDATELRIDAQRAFDGVTRVNPPLPSRDDALALLEAVADGTIDAIATDHAPHTVTDTLVEFAAAAPGISGLETALSLTLAAVAAGRIGLGEALAALSTRPAALLGEERSVAPGAVADLVVFDPDATWRVEESALASRGRNTPLLGMELPGRVMLTVAAGRVTYDATG
ncbi:MAG: amidohydrolase family protein, partial [Chloroflexota bacterium]|nr:amidohydrolase family protein [Chloroflexota bacterium]